MNASLHNGGNKSVHFIAMANANHRDRKHFPPSAALLYGEGTLNATKCFVVELSSEKRCLQIDAIIGAIATADLLCNLDALVAKLALISNITIEAIVQKHTLYPFYAAFLPPERSQQTAEAMRSGMVEAFTTNHPVQSLLMLCFFDMLVM